MKKRNLQNAILKARVMARKAIEKHESNMLGGINGKEINGRGLAASQQVNVAPQNPSVQTV